ncbi:hypothetical protein ACFS5N_10100 [Mucilaginibacter ximonensis]|uniref:Carboxypeptidase-like protein n=1 Tax=Mucilaginibacter ximonensis TaxID=538021 RepID=A0ABW5YC08_9SPHI
MKFALIVLLCLICTRVPAQDKLSGIIFDTDSKDRLSRVNITNSSKGFFVFDNVNGAFEVDAKIGDKIIFTAPDHHPDTVIVRNYTPIAVYLKSTSIHLKPVNIVEKKLDPQSMLDAKKRDYSKAYGHLADKDFLNMAPGIGVGLGIDAIWNAFSREGRNAAHLRETIENDYKQDVIDSRFNSAFVGRVTGLTGERLKDFMKKYRPGYYFLESASDYELINSIRTNYRRYMRNPAAHTLIPLDSLKK